MPEHVILFAGPMGAGKTTAIRSLSEIEVVGTEAANTDRETADKPTTTVALDYGEISLGDDEKVRLYGIPGQKRFDFMWQILRERAEGMVLLVPADTPDPVGRMLEFLEEFDELYERGGVIVGISRSELSVAGLAVSDYADAARAIYPDRVIPIFTVDTRSAEHMRLLLMTLVVNIEMRAAFGVQGRVA
jgi:signal recognition particle receptor subunit beta